MTTPLPRRLKVLVADPSRDGADSLADLTRLYGCRATTAYTTSETVVLLHTRRFDIAFIDPALLGVSMGQVIGHALAPSREVRPFVIAVSECPSEEWCGEGLSAGVNLYLTKPLPPGLIGGLLRRLQPFIYAMELPADLALIVGHTQKVSS
ncbi:response regulator [Limnoglobus roseus]|uniref:Response regulator n=1 Tax=Limnoglobus roseus TaxID=2598579 RepID=A0A5C1AS01_9BACT|nr:response regulator [Limnoglobus roseus]QEL20482.1 response regulator [Limnoglobus roseus]